MRACGTVAGVEAAMPSEPAGSAGAGPSVRGNHSTTASAAVATPLAGHHQARRDRVGIVVIASRRRARSAVAVAPSSASTWASKRARA
jgi:hypothetical protein